MNENDAVIMGPSPSRLAAWVRQWDVRVSGPDLHDGLLYTTGADLEGVIHRPKMAGPLAWTSCAHAVRIEFGHMAPDLQWTECHHPAELVGHTAKAHRYDIVVVVDDTGPGLMGPAANLVERGGHLMGGHPCPPAHAPGPAIIVADIAARGLNLYRWETTSVHELYHFHRPRTPFRQFAPISPGAFTS